MPSSLEGDSSPYGRDVGRRNTPAYPELPDLFGYPQPCMVTVCGGAAPRGAPVRLWILLVPQCPRLRRLSGGAAALVLPRPLSARFARLPLPSSSFAVGARPPTPPGARFARGAAWPLRSPPVLLV